MQKSLVALQFVFIILFFITGPILASKTVYLLMEAAGLILGGWAIVYMVKHSRFSGIPEPAGGAALLAAGPYRFIRNPMYAAIMFVMGTMLLDFFTWTRLFFYLVEISVLLVKIFLEEKYLTAKFPGYAAYKSRTKRIIPFVY